MPKLSIIIPTLNEEENLPKLLTSLGDNKEKDIEVIIADANSTDGTKEIAKKFNCKIVQGGKVAYGRNNAGRHAKGDYLLFIDADTILTHGFLDKLMKKIKKTEAAGFALIPDSDKIIDKMMQAFFNFYNFIIQFFFPHAQGPIIFSTKKMFLRLGGFDESLKIAEDHDYVVRASKLGKFKWFYNPKAITSMRRYYKIGRAKILFLYIKCEAIRMFKGEIKDDIFDYQFDIYKKSKK
ncbi:MAG: glycosyltransferase [Candidatus Paceibacterota bacterium]|jgi:glycosyltransferase involved in cell wall biosynthesis